MLKQENNDIRNAAASSDEWQQVGGLLGNVLGNLKVQPRAAQQAQPTTTNVVALAPRAPVAKAAEASTVKPAARTAQVERQGDLFQTLEAA